MKPATGAAGIRKDTFLTLVASLFPVALLAWSLPLWRVGTLSYDSTLLRIQQPGISKGLPAFPPFSVTCSVLLLIQVRDTETAKGFGAYCIQAPIPKHSFLGFYEGQLQHDLKDCHAGYFMNLGTAFCDGYKRAQDRSVFSPVHLNYCDRDKEGCNCLGLLENGK